MCLLSKITCVHEIKAYTKEELIKITKREIDKREIRKTEFNKAAQTPQFFSGKEVLLGIPAIATEILRPQSPILLRFVQFSKKLSSIW